MFVCVHDLEYVSDTGSLFICPGTRRKDWGNLSLINKAWVQPSRLPYPNEPSRGWQDRHHGGGVLGVRG